MTGTDLALIAVIAVAPLAIVLIIALIRGYTITVHMTREVNRWRRRRGNDNGDD